MGCDIFIVFEEKDYTGSWKEVIVEPGNIYPEDRHYEAWSFLFGVRNDPKWKYTSPCFPRRGVPEDCSIKELIEDYKNIDDYYHSYTYLHANEIECLEWPDSLKDCYFKIFLDYVFPRISKSYNRLENIRMIVYFHS